MLAKLHNDQSGATSTEYIVLLICIACFCIAVVKIYGETLENKFEWANQRIVKHVKY